MKIVIPEKSLSLRELEKRYVLKVLKENGGNKKKASEILGIDRATLYRILEKEGVVEFRNTIENKINAVLIYELGANIPLVKTAK
jgi:predicted transcriptional regulator